MIMYYVGWYLPNNAFLNCGPEFSNTFFAFLGTSPGNDGDLLLPGSTALYCKTNYFQKPVLAKVYLRNSSVIDTEPIGLPISLSTGFNTSNFDMLLGSTIFDLEFGHDDSLSTNVMPDADIDDAVVDLTIGNEFRGTIWPYVNFDDALLSPWVFTKKVQPFDVYNDPDTLHDTLQAAHTLLFSLAMSKMLQPAALNQTASYGNFTRQEAAITMDETFTILSQVALGILATIGLLTFTFNVRRSMKLVSNPTNMLRVVSLLDHSVFSEVQRLQSYTARAERHVLTQQYKLTQDAGNMSQNRVNLVQHSPFPAIHDTNSKEKNLALPRSMSIPVLLSLLFILMLVVMLLAILQREIGQRNGLAPPSSNHFVRNLLLIYLPTAFATLLEPVWVVIIRDLCFIEPFKSLFGGRAKARDCLATKLTIAPPQFAIFAAVCVKRTLLVILCVVALAANVLGVVMSGLLQIRPTTVVQPTAFIDQLQPILQGGDSARPNGNYSNYDNYYIVNQTFPPTNVWPSWTNDEYFFLPWALNGSIADNNWGFVQHAITTGVGVVSTCSADGISANLTDNDGTINFQFNRTLPIAFDPTLSSPNGTVPVVCYGTGFIGPGSDGNGTDISPTSSNPRRLAAEAFFQPVSTQRENAWGTNGPDTSPEDSNAPKPPPSTGAGSDALCGTYLFGSWLRTNPAPNEGVMLVEADEDTMGMAGTFLACRSHLNVAKFNVTVDASGSILSAEQLGPSVSNMSTLVDGPDALGDWEAWLSRLLTGTDRDPNDDLEPSRQDASFAAAWLNHFIGQLTNSLDLVDPAKPLPDPAVLGPQVEQIIRRFFAIFMSSNQQAFLPVSPNATDAQKFVQGSVEITEQRVFFVPRAFQIAIAILSFDIFAVILLLLHRPKRTLPRMPTNIWSTASYVCHSHFFKDLLDGKTTVEEMEKDDKTYYGYGTFIGTDGKPHVGIERCPMVSTVASGDEGNGLWRHMYSKLRLRKVFRYNRKRG